MVKPINLGIDKKVKDPVRFPKIINPLENEAKMVFVKGISDMRLEITEQMNKILKK